MTVADLSKPSPPEHYGDDVIPALHAWQRAGHRTALLTLIRIDGSSPRPLGSQLAVCEDGRSAGLITGGCAEASLVLEGQQAIAAGKRVLLRYGEGSPFLDIRLPCGSSIEVLVTPFVDEDTLVTLQAARRDRQCATLRLDLETGHMRALTVSPRRAGAERQGNVFHLFRTPPAHILALGKGPGVIALARLAQEAGYGVEVYSPEAEVVAGVRASGLTAHPLTRPGDIDTARFDLWTALCLFFHDHDWEPDILTDALQCDYFYIGALGSRATHKNRLELLRARGIGEDALKRIAAPIGLDIGAVNPAEIALSTLAEIVAAWRRRA